MVVGLSVSDTVFLLNSSSTDMWLVVIPSYNVYTQKLLFVSCKFCGYSINYVDINVLQNSSTTFYIYPSWASMLFFIYFILKTCLSCMLMYSTWNAYDPLIFVCRFFRTSVKSTERQTRSSRSIFRISLDSRMPPTDCRRSSTTTLDASEVSVPKDYGHFIIYQFIDSSFCSRLLLFKYKFPNNCCHKYYLKTSRDFD